MIVRLSPRLLVTVAAVALCTSAALAAGASTFWNLTAGGRGAFSSESFGALMPDFERSAKDDELQPAIALGANLVLVCFHPRPVETSARSGLEACGEASGIVAILPAGDLAVFAAPASPVPRAGAVPAFAKAVIGRSLPEALKIVEGDEDFAGKTVTYARDRTVLMLSATFKDPPPAKYDHGFQATSLRRYLFRNGRVAAIVLQDFEN